MFNNIKIELNIERQISIKMIKNKYKNTVEIGQKRDWKAGDPDTCPICLENIDEKTTVVQLLCNHVFHYSCIEKLIKSIAFTQYSLKCPLCRWKPMNDEENLENLIISLLKKSHDNFYIVKSILLEDDYIFVLPLIIKFGFFDKELLNLYFQKICEKTKIEHQQNYIFELFESIYEYMKEVEKIYPFAKELPQFYDFYSSMMSDFIENKNEYLKEFFQQSHPSFLFQKEFCSIFEKSREKLTPIFNHIHYAMVL